MSWLEQLNEPSTRRQTLLFLRDSESQNEMMTLLKENEAYFINLLEDEDPKVRKLCAELMAKSGHKIYRNAILALYQKEKQRMILPSLVRSLGYFDLSDILETLEKREKQLQDELDGEMRKHAKEELRMLRQILKPYRELPKHVFTGFKKPVSMILTIANGHQEALMDELAWLETKKVSLGVQVKTNDFDRLFENHLFSAIYFPICKTETSDPKDVCSQPVIDKILKFLNQCHQGDFAYRIRVDHEDPQMAKKIAEMLEMKSRQLLENHPNDYEIEIRLRTNKSGQGLVYLKLLTIKDERFSYRKKISASSLAGHTAALITHYLQDYVQPEGQVIDPLCNDGTLLIERCYAAHPHFVMALDMHHELLDMAKYNANEAGVDIRFVQRDIKSFTHRRRFDELLTKLPAMVRKDEKETVERLYQKVFDRIPELVGDRGIAAIYTSENKLIQKLYQRHRQYLELQDKIGIIGNECLYIYRVWDPASH